MATANSVSTANSILNKGRKPPKGGASVTDAKQVIEKSSQHTTDPNPVPNYASETPNSNSPENRMYIIDLEYVFLQALNGTDLITEGDWNPETIEIIDGGAP